MGKNKKSSKLKSSAGDLVSASSVPLDVQIEQSVIESSRLQPRNKQRETKRHLDDDQYVDGTLSRKIMRLASKQKKEEERGSKDDETIPKITDQVDTANFRSQKINFADASDDESVSDNDLSEEFIPYDDSIVEIDPDDEALIEKFIIRGEAAPTLADVINEKIEKKKVVINLEMNKCSADDFLVPDLDPVVIEMYREVGHVLSRYRSGKIPKAFKLLPKMINWEHLLYLTNPDKWSAAAMYQATRIFASNLNAKMCQRFYNLVLLPRLRDDIAEFKKLNFHLFQAMHKAMYKPMSFFKGILIPLCESGTCTLREATIFGSVLSKASIPMLHAAAAMLNIAKMEYTGSNSLFLRIFVEKKYTLPYLAITELVKHFVRFKKLSLQLPVLWHQSLLAFVKHYKNDLSDDQRTALQDLINVQHHYQITIRIREELQHCEA